MAKLTIWDNDALANIVAGKGVARNPDGTYEVSSEGGEIFVLDNKPKAGLRGWQCACEVGDPAIYGFFYYYMGQKLIIRNEDQRDLYVYLGNEQSHHNTKLIEIFLGNGSLPVKIVDSKTGCFICLGAYGGSNGNGDTSVPTAELICRFVNGIWQGYTLKVTNRTGKNVQVVLKNKDGGITFNQGFSGDNRQVVGFAVGRGFIYIDGIGEVPITVPFCKAPPKD